MATSSASNTIGSSRSLAGSSTILPLAAVKVLTVASSPGMPATTMSPCSAVGLGADDHEVAVEDADVDHRVARAPAA